MSVALIDVGRVLWGSYAAFEGPVFWGAQRFETPTDPTYADKLMAVLSATEGGHYDAVNMYDRCILTVGIIQWCEAAPQCSVSDMLGLCAQANESKLLEYLRAIDPSIDVREENGVARLWYRGAKVDTTPAQRALYLGGASGLKDQWMPAQKAWARKVAAVMASIWQEPEFRQAQIAYTYPRLVATYGAGFSAKAKALFAPGFDENSWAGAMRAIFISYSANLPAVAAGILDRTALSNDPAEACVTLAKALALTSGVGIWPRRYEMIRPTVEALFGVDLPDHTPDLAAWHASLGPAAALSDPTAMQQALVDLGYDLGPYGPKHNGVDGRPGQKTQAALAQFQKKAGLPAHGVADFDTLRALWAAVQQVRTR